MLGAEHPATATSLNNLAISHYYQNQFAAAAELMRRALAINEQQRGPDHPNTQRSRQNLAAIELGLAGNPTPPSAESQIAQITQQAEAAVAQALAESSAAQRAALAQQLATLVGQIDGEAEGSPPQWVSLLRRSRPHMDMFAAAAGEKVLARTLGPFIASE